MLSKIIQFSINNKILIFLLTSVVVGFGIYSFTQIPIGAVPDITNNQVQVITTSKNLSTQDIEQFITYPVELEMSNLPGVIEIRSISKFGLSVVTIVFEESMGTFLPRQLIAEKLVSVREKILEGFGTPEMGPISTGLGEIYQYILDVEDEYKDKYDATELRTIQDWIVKRQLSSINGVVEINTWGGFLKQYEVALSTSKLTAMNIAIGDIFAALEKNNSVAGGGYIEKVNQSYFIRGEGLMNSLEDIENTVVTTRNGIPILVKDVAKVGFGSATRFGAVSANGEGEKVMGQVMMLKGANSEQVIKNVKERIKSIQKSLPEGVYINGFLDRSELIKRTTFTIYENLFLGILIVIFVVFLLLGNWRSSLVIVSIIPLSLMFTLGLMYLFGVDVNLMSMGAIDFGIIIDGAVIVVEYIAFIMMTQKEKFFNLTKEQAQKLRNKITFNASRKMMSAAIFGQLIILIVFIPILSLGGVEGKMFKPMAMTFSFALLGALFFGLTFIPAFASLIIKPYNQSDKNISKRILQLITKLYDPVIHWAMNSKRMVVSLSVIVLIAAVLIFSKMGAEFVPILDEGDFVIQPVLKTGTSLKKTIEITTKIEKILLDFPEVKQVVSRIGAAEVPTDPMSMEEVDVIVILNPKDQWVTVKTKDELADKFKNALSVIPNMEMEFTQPIEMRFNELISGARSDVAIKLFGDDLDLLHQKANEIKRAIINVKGAADITVEKTTALPQMLVKYDRKKLALYGLNIVDLNKVITMGFLGSKVGSIFEGEKKFDLVLRLDKSNRKDITDLKNLYIDLPNSGKITLSEVADISYHKGAAKISRENTRRRINIGVNVRNRDLQSVVDDIKHIIDTQVKLPVGYSIMYGGQYENLQSAKKRLILAVPISLLLIFVLLYFAFKSLKEALLIYTAIPFATVGGILFLWIRDLPFSISAGIGFIALFGIAVLNGIILIEVLKEFKNKGLKNDDNLIISAVKSRLRPVFLTALSTAFGFFPMAVSTGAGAEVQRPLSTVVIGGLMTSTLLTLVVLPVLYSLFLFNKNKIKVSKSNIITILLIFFSIGVSAQNKALSLDEIKQLAYKNNKSLKTLELIKKQIEVEAGTSVFDKTNFSYEYLDDKITEKEGVFYTFGISQSFSLPTVYRADKLYKRSKVEIAESNLLIEKTKLDKQLTLAFYNYQYAQEKKKIYSFLDSLYSDFSKKSERKFELGLIYYLEKITAKSKYEQIKLQHQQAKYDVKESLLQLQTLAQNFDFEVANIPFKQIRININDINNNVGFTYYEAQKKRLFAEKKLLKNKLLPEFSVGYNYGINTFLDGTLKGFNIGLNIPFLRSKEKVQINMLEVEKEIIEQQISDFRFQLQMRQQQLKNALEKHQKSLIYYNTEGKDLYEAIINTAIKSFKHGEIDFFQYIQSIEMAYQIKLSYLENLNKYNQAVIEINHLILKK